MWHVGKVIALRDETPTARTIALEIPDWPGHASGQRVDVRLTAPDGYSAVRSYSIASTPTERRVELTVEQWRAPKNSVSSARAGPAICWAARCTAVSEDSLDRDPWFNYFDVYYQGLACQCLSNSGLPVANGCGFSAKAALAWSSLYSDDYARLLETAARPLASRGGFLTGLHPGGKANTILNINTNAIILEAMSFRQRGRRAFLEESNGKE
jgi:uncharacterized protein DUF3131